MPYSARSLQQASIDTQAARPEHKARAGCLLYKVMTAEGLERKTLPAETYKADGMGQEASTYGMNRAEAPGKKSIEKWSGILLY